MRKNYRKSGINGADNLGNAKTENINLPNRAAQNPEKSSKIESTQQPNQSLKRAMAAVDGVFPDIVDDARLHRVRQRRADEIAISNLSLEEKLEEELASNFHSTASSLYMPDLHDSRKIENVAQSVSNDCENLMAACGPPQEPDEIYLHSQRREAIQSETRQQFSFSSTITRIKRGIYSTLNGAFGLSANKITAVLLVALATGAGIYTYNNPDNPVQLALLSKVDQFVAQRNVAEPTQFANIANASIIELAPKPEPVAVKVRPANQLRSQIVSTVQEMNKLSGKEDKIAALPRENSIPNTTPNPIPSVSIVSTKKIAVPANTAGKDVQTPAYVDEVVNLSERFESGVRSAVSNQISPDIPEAKPEVKEITDLSNSSRQTALLKTQPVNKIRKRNIVVVEQVVRTANAGNAINDNQLKALVTKLGAGECVSPALSGVLGDNKVSPVFVRDLLINLENRC